MGSALSLFAFHALLNELPLQGYGNARSLAVGLPNGTTMAKDNGDLLQGTLGILVLKALASRAELHGYGVARWIESVTGDVLRIEEGSLYPALRRLEDRGFVSAEWGRSENNRRARYYRITRAGKRHLQAASVTWVRFASAVLQVLRVEPALA